MFVCLGVAGVELMFAEADQIGSLRFELGFQTLFRLFAIFNNTSILKVQYMDQTR